MKKIEMKSNFDVVASGWIYLILVAVLAGALFGIVGATAKITYKLLLGL
jgi:uncharacterized protein involved in exopolysaccharide biosynthesis